MQEINPYRTFQELEQDLDNGGRFYNLFTKAGDRVVSSAELKKAASVVASEYVAFLYLEMAVSDLVKSRHSSIAELLEPDLLSRFDEQKPNSTVPSQVGTDPTVGTSLIVSGYTRYLSDKTRFQGMITIPITTGNSTMYMLQPIYDHFELFEMFDEREMNGRSCLIATPAGTKFEGGCRLRIGGLVRKAEFEHGAEDAQPHYLEAYYYTRL